MAIIPDFDVERAVDAVLFGTEALRKVVSHRTTYFRADGSTTTGSANVHELMQKQ